MIKVAPFSAEATIIRTSPPPAPSPEVLARIDQLWADEQESRGAAIENGRILSLFKTDSAKLQVWETQYKWWIAQRRDPSLFSEIRIRPLAVTAFTHLGNAIVVARRSHELTQDAGLWEIPPSGSVDADRALKNGTIDIVAQLHSELSTELNIGPSLVLALRPFALMEDTVDNVVDIVFDVCLAPHREEVESLFEVRASTEYTEIGIWPFSNLRDHLARERQQMSPSAVAILIHRGLIPSETIWV